jgi:hypothetical protein
MGMLLYGLCLDPLLCMLNETLQGIQLGIRMVIPAVTAYADDVTVFLTSPSDVQHLQDPILCYELATGVRVNINKSKVVALCPWNKGLSVLNTPYHDSYDSRNRNEEHTTCHKYIQLEQGNRTRQGTNHGGLRPRSKPCTANTLRTCIPVCSAWHIAQIYIPQRRTFDRLLQQLPNSYGKGTFSCTYNDTISAEDGRRMESI